MGFSRQGYWSGLPLPLLWGIFPTQVLNPGLLLQADALPSEPPGKPSSLNFSLLRQQSQDCFPVEDQTESWEAVQTTQTLAFISTLFRPASLCSVLSLLCSRYPRILEWVAYPFSSGSSQPRNQTRDSCIAGGFFTR